MSPPGGGPDVKLVSPPGGGPDVMPMEPAFVEKLVMAPNGSAETITMQTVAQMRTKLRSLVILHNLPEHCWPQYFS